MIVNSYSTTRQFVSLLTETLAPVALLSEMEDQLPHMPREPERGGLRPYY